MMALLYIFVRIAVRSLSSRMLTAVGRPRICRAQASPPCRLKASRSNLADGHFFAKHGPGGCSRKPSIWS